MRLVPVILASGIALALNTLTVTTLWLVVTPHSADNMPRFGEYMSNVLTGWGGGIVGVLGAYIGYSYGRNEKERDTTC